MRSKLPYLLVALLFLAACRSDHLQQNLERSEHDKPALVSRIISLNESAHKAKIAPMLSELKQSYKSSVAGKGVSFGDSISIDTDNVIYIENGPNYHTYTFNIRRVHAGPGDPVENLVLSPLSDGTYRELLVTYNITQQEKENIRKGYYFYSGKNTTIKELAAGTFNGGHQLARQSCGWETRTGWNKCSSKKHDGSNFNECEYINNLSSGGTPPTTYTYSLYVCKQVVDVTIAPSDPPGGGGGGGGGGTPCTDCPPPTGNTDPGPTDCVQVPTNPQNPSTFIGENGCAVGTPTLPNMGNPRNSTPCAKTKAMLQKPEVQAKINNLKALSMQKYEYGFKVDAAGIPTPLITQNSEHDINFGTYTGYPKNYHIHPPKKIKMFSVGDFLNLLTTAIYQPGAENSAQSGMIGSTICSACPDGYYYYHYVITFTGNPAELNTLVNGTNWDIDKLIKTYTERELDLRLDPQYQNTQLETISNKGLEKLFFETLKNMNLENKISLQRVDSNGTVQNITLDANNEPKPTPCP